MFLKTGIQQSKAEILREQGKETQGTRTDLLPIVDKKLGHDTRKEIADKLKWSTGKESLHKKGPGGSRTSTGYKV